MKYVKIKASNYNEALRELKDKYGPDAIPISHKYIKEGGLLNTKLFAKDICELTAGVNERKSAPRPAAPRGGINLVADADVTKGVFGRNALDDAPKTAAPNAATIELMRQLQAREEAVAEAPKRVVRPETAEEIRKPVETARDDDYTAKLEKDIRELKDAICRMASGGDAAAKEEDEFPSVSEILAGNDYTEEESRRIMTEVKKSLTIEERKDPVRIEKSLRELFMSRIVVAGPITATGKKKAVLFAGPTGVGKTTSLAKLGAILSLKEQKRVAFITIDTYRIAATEQLKKYAEIMKIPIYVVSDQKELKSVVEREKADVILIDTSGRSHRNTLKISELKSYADSIDCDLEKILCVSAGIKKRDMQEIFRAYEPLGIDSVLITKTDETSFIGNIVDVADTYNKPISYVANGQEVPNDIFVADPEKLAGMMMGVLKV